MPFFRGKEVVSAWALGLPRKAENATFSDRFGRSWVCVCLVRKDGTPKMRKGKEHLIWVPDPNDSDAPCSAPDSACQDIGPPTLLSSVVPCEAPDATP